MTAFVSINIVIVLEEGTVAIGNDPETGRVSTSRRDRWGGGAPPRAAIRMSATSRNRYLKPRPLETSRGNWAHPKRRV